MKSSKVLRLHKRLRKLLFRTGAYLVAIVLRRWPTMYNQASYLKTIVRSIPERSLLQSINRHVIDMTVIRHVDFERYCYTAKLPPAFRTEMHFARRHVYHMKDVCVNVRTGACCTSQHGFQESFGSIRRWLSFKPVTFQRCTPLSIDGPATCIHTTGFAHYLLEEVPRLLWTLQQNDRVHVMTPAHLPQYVSNILSDLKYRGRIKGEIIPHEEEVLSVPDFFFTQAEAYSGFWHTNDLSLLRECFLPSTSRQQDSRHQIYVSRLHSRRSYSNEAEVEACMRARGVEVTYLEDIGFREQVSLFNQADLVISPHGAGMANLVWCSPGTTVIELFTSEVFNDCFARLCSRLECNYRPLWATSLSTDAVIDVNRLEKIMIEPGS